VWSPGSAAPTQHNGPIQTGVIAMPVSVAGQTTPVQPIIPIERLMRFRPRTSTGMPLITVEDHARLTQIQVSLAWLADPATFSCPLHAAASASVLEVRGTVPDYTARAHALGLAERYRGRLTLIDALSIGPVPAYRRGVTDSQELYRAALAALSPAMDKSV